MFRKARTQIGDAISQHLKLSLGSAIRISSRLPPPVARLLFQQVGEELYLSFSALAAV